MKIYDEETAVRLATTFCIAFILNFIWEHAHALMYAHYKSDLITNAILFKATLGDALFITALSIPFYRINLLRNNVWLIIPIGITAAVLLELFALSTGRWAYNSLMPLVPFIGTGFTPTIQLGLLGYATLIVVRKYCKHTNLN